MVLLIEGSDSPCSAAGNGNLVISLSLRGLKIHNNIHSIFLYWWSHILFCILFSSPESPGSLIMNLQLVSKFTGWHLQKLNIYNLSQENASVFRRYIFQIFKVSITKYFTSQDQVTRYENTLLTETANNHLNSTIVLIQGK